MTKSSDRMQELKPRHIGTINFVGLQTLVKKEVGRFLNVYTQTVIAPMVTTLLFFTVFALAFGGIKRHVGDVPFLEFLAPGLIMMAMAQNAFANTSSSLVIAKVQGNIVDVLMPPLSALELLIGFVSGSLLRGLMVGAVTGFAVSVFVPLPIYSVATIILFAVLGSMMMGTLGVIAGVWSVKFDHIAAFTNFIVTPLTFLSGTFYSIDVLPGIWRTVAQYNPFFHMIDGFRSGFIEQADGHALVGASVLIGINLFLILLAHRMLATGYKIKN